MPRPSAERPSPYNCDVAVSSSRRSGSKVANSLVAVGSAAVLAIYTAGYAKTRAAADRFADAAERPRPAVPTPTPAPEKIASASAPSERVTPPVMPAPTKTKKTKSAIVDPVATPLGPARVTPKPVPAKSTPASATVSTPVPTPDPTPDPTPTPAAPAKPEYKDGKFFGWGRSRHGDIQAAVVIEDGKIVYAAITDCQTRYPCDVIAKLPGQVLERQSADVDFVAGATESANAFYYAILQALTQAK